VHPFLPKIKKSFQDLPKNFCELVPTYGMSAIEKLHDIALYKFNIHIHIHNEFYLTSLLRCRSRSSGSVSPPSRLISHIGTYLFDTLPTMS